MPQMLLDWVQQSELNNEERAGLTMAEAQRVKESQSSQTSAQCYQSDVDAKKRLI